MLEPWYATRRDVKEALQAPETARTNYAIDRALGSASRSIDQLCHRKFYPWTGTKYFPWPDGNYSRAWRLWLDEHDLISVTSLMSGTTLIGSSLYNLEPVNSGPPFESIELRLDQPGSFGQSNNRQRDISIEGLWNYRNDETNVGTIPAQLSAGSLTLTVSAATAAVISAGSLIRIGTERMIVWEVRLADTAVNLGADLAGDSAVTSVSVADGTQFSAGEDILIGPELMRITDIAGNTLVVIRAWDGSVLAAHSSGADIYARRALYIHRGQLGTTDATHLVSSAIYVHNPPPLVRDLCIAESVSMVLQETAGYGRMAGQGDNAREMSGKALKDLRLQVYHAHGRTARIGAV